MRICGQNPRINAGATFQDPVSEQQRSVHSTSSHYDGTKVVILEYRVLVSITVKYRGIEYRRYRWYRPNPSVASTVQYQKTPATQYVKK